MPATYHGGGSDAGQDFLMTSAQECITKGSILGTYLSVCLGWIKAGNEVNVMSMTCSTHRH